MKTFSFVGLAILLASPLLALPADVQTESEQTSVFDKRTGHINVKTWSDGQCGNYGGKGQGETAVGTSGKCVNMSNAGSLHIGGPSAKNPSGCAYVHAQYYLNTGCNDPMRESITYGPHSCVTPLYASAYLKCVH